MPSSQPSGQPSSHPGQLDTPEPTVELMPTPEPTVEPSPSPTKHYTSMEIISQPWKAIASSADGLRLCAVANPGGIFTSVNGGMTWNATTAPLLSWAAVTSSADGNRLAAAPDSGWIYTSIDSGNSWTQTSGYTWGGRLIGSADGLKLISFASSAVIMAPLLSIDGGQNWNSLYNLYGDWASVAMSGDGGSIAVSREGGIYISLDSGNSWTLTFAPSGGNAIASSEDGMKLCVVQGTSIYTSKDGGNTWSTYTVTFPGLYMTSPSVSSSADGMRIAIAHSGGILTSSDGGSTWQTATLPSIPFNSIVLSADGERLAATQPYGGGIFLTKDGGVTWYSEFFAARRNFFQVVNNADMTKFAAIVQNGYVFTSTDFTQTWQYHLGAGIRYWQSVGISADGNTIAATDAGGDTYFSPDGGLKWCLRNTCSFGSNNGTAVPTSAPISATVAPTSASASPTFVTVDKRLVEHFTGSIIGRHHAGTSCTGAVNKREVLSLDTCRSSPKSKSSQVGGPFFRYAAKSSHNGVLALVLKVWYLDSSCKALADVNVGGENPHSSVLYKLNHGCKHSTNIHYSYES